MIAFSQGSSKQRRTTASGRDENSDVAAASTALPSAGGFGGFNFASALETAKDCPKSGSTTPWDKALELVRAGGGSARITLNIASGEKVDLRVTVRGGLVTVFVNAGSRAAAEALRAAQDTIARSLLETGLKLHRFHVRRSDAEALKAKRMLAHKKQQQHLTSDHEDREEQS